MHPWEAFLKHHDRFRAEGGPWPPQGIDGCPKSEAEFARWRAEFEAPKPEPVPEPAPVPDPEAAPGKPARRRAN